MLLAALPSPIVMMAMDRAPSTRMRDTNGFLHVEVSNISKANVCPYYGREIPDWQALGLDPARVYQLYRDPEELARAAPTFNRLPLLSKHLPVLPEELPDDLIIGSTGGDAEFEAPFLKNSLVVWCGAHQQGIDTGRKRELSCGYRYRADMTPGQCAGIHYDGVMRDIVGNHVAIVIEGRAGPDVLVGDETMKLMSRTALMISGAVTALVRPKLAADAKVDLTDALKGVNAKTFAMDGAPAALATKIEALVKPHLAADQTVDLGASLAAITPIAQDEDAIEEARTADDDDPDKPKPAADADKKGDDKPAMDEATVNRKIAEAEARGAARVANIDQAKRDVQPFVGEVVGMDSAEGIYRMALDGAKIDYPKMADLATLKAMVGMLPKPGSRRAIAADAAPVGASKLDAIVPGLKPLIRS